MIQLQNDTKIRFVNAVDALLTHARECEACTEYMQTGEGDLCDWAKISLAHEMAFADMKPIIDENFVLLPDAATGPCPPASLSESVLPSAVTTLAENPHGHLDYE